MNGRVVAVLVKPGETVAAGQPVMTLEAMKMEHVHTAAIAGTIAAIDVAEGEQVTTGRIVVEIEAGGITIVVPAKRASRALSRDPYRVIYRFQHAVRRPVASRPPVAMATLRSQGRRS